MVESVEFKHPRQPGRFVEGTVIHHPVSGFKPPWTVYMIELGYGEHFASTSRHEKLSHIVEVHLDDWSETRDGTESQGIKNAFGSGVVIHIHGSETYGGWAFGEPARKSLRYVPKNKRCVSGQLELRSIQRIIAKVKVPGHIPPVIALGKSRAGVETKDENLHPCSPRKNFSIAGEPQQASSTCHTELEGANWRDLEATSQVAGGLEPNRIAVVRQGVELCGDPKVKRGPWKERSQ